MSEKPSAPPSESYPSEPPPPYAPTPDQPPYQIQQEHLVSGSAPYPQQSGPPPFITTPSGQSTTTTYYPPPTSATTTVMVTSTTRFGPNPVTMECPNCHAQILTEMYPLTGALTWLLFFICLVLGCWLGCCLIPFCVDSCKNIAHRCPHCKTYLGTYSRM